MKSSKLAVSLLGLVLFLPAVALAQTETTTGQNAVAQVQVALPPEVIKLIEEKRALAEISDPELKARLKAAKAFAEDASLPPEVQDQMKAIASAAKAELEARAQAAAPAEPAPPAQPQAKAEPAAPQADQPADAPAAKPKPQVAEVQAAPPAPAALPPMVEAVLGDQRPVAEMKTDDLSKRLKIVQHFLKDPALSPEVKAQLQAVAEGAKAELANRQAAADAKAKADAQAAADAKAAADAQAAADAKAAAAAPQPPAQAAAADPAAPAMPAVAPPATAPTKAPERPLDKPVSAAPAPAPAVALAPQPEQVQQLDANAGDPAAEKQAKAYISDAADVTKLSDDELRKRLDDVRELLAANQLSQATERAVRAKLLKEREVLRTRMAQAEAAKQQQAAAQPGAAPVQPGAAKPQAGAAPQPAQPTTPPPPLAATVKLPPAPTPPPAVNPGGGINFNLAIGFVSGATAASIVLSDRRPPQQLQVPELQRRIQVYDEAILDNRYDPSYRDYWRRSLDYNRAVLRERLRQERRMRAAEQAANQDAWDFEIDAPPPRQMPRNVFAAEVDDAELQDVLTARPSGSYQRRYKVQDIAANPGLREAIPRVDIDTVHFGYNEGFIREEELSHLDNIATIIERVVKKYPGEVFLIEGHTDAAGSDAYNLKLSKLRAESVKRMMTTYYNIPAKSLRTVGLGERFLKIPTADAEPENRRVSVARITGLLGQGQ